MNVRSTALKAMIIICPEILSDKLKRSLNDLKDKKSPTIIK